MAARKSNAPQRPSGTPRSTDASASGSAPSRAGTGASAGPGAGAAKKAAQRSRPGTRAQPAADGVDLRQRILDTSRALLDEQGAAALSLREVARRAGVTHQAPYHHFADRESILAELVTQGFDELTRRLSRARRAGQSPHQCLVASCRAYVAFALEHPGVFRIMFRHDLCDAARFAPAIAAGLNAHAELMQMVQAAHGPEMQAQPKGIGSEMMANLHWAQVHGLACLLLDGPLGLQLPTDTLRRSHVRRAMSAFATRMLAPTTGA